MQLNNKTNGNIITLSKIKDGGTFYKLWENKFCLDNQLFEIDKKVDVRNMNITPETPMSELELKEYTSNLKVLETETNFELSDDIQNWVCENRPIRMTILTDLVNPFLIDEEHAAFANILNREIEANKLATDKFIFYNGNTVVAYFFTITDEDAPIVTPYIERGEIHVEYKNV